MLQTCFKDERQRKRGRRQEATISKPRHQRLPITALFCDDHNSLQSPVCGSNTTISPASHNSWAVWRASKNRIHGVIPVRNRKSNFSAKHSNLNRPFPVLVNVLSAVSDSSIRVRIRISVGVSTNRCARLRKWRADQFRQFQRQPRCCRFDNRVVEIDVVAHRLRSITERYRSVGGDG